MPSYTEEEKSKAVETIGECGRSVTRTIRKLGYPSRQALCQRLNGRDASHERKAGGPWRHGDPALKAQAVAFVRSGMTGGNVAETLGVSGAAVACNRVRAAGNPSRAAADGSPIEPMRASGERAFDGFGESLGERVRRLELGNDILRAAAKVLKAAGPGPVTNGEKTLVVNEPRASKGRGPRGLTASLRISKSSYDYRRGAPERPDEYTGLRALAREIFGSAGGSRGHRCVTHGLRSGEDPIIAPEKVVRRIMREDGPIVAYSKKKARCGSCRGEISDAPENPAGRGFHAGAPNGLRLTDITELMVSPMLV